MVEIIGLMISLLALIYLFIKQTIPSRRQAYLPSDQYEEVVEEEDDDPFNAFMKVVEKEVAAKEVVPRILPRPSVSPKTKQQSKKPPTVTLEECRMDHSSRAQVAIRRLAKRRDILIYQEIMNQPKSLRTEVPNL